MISGWVLLSQDSNNSVRRIRSEWVQIRKYQALRILHADTPTRLLSVSAHEPQTFSANLRQPKNSNKQQTFEKRMTKTEEFHIISVKIFLWGFICQKRIIFCMMSVCPM